MNFDFHCRRQTKLNNLFGEEFFDSLGTRRGFVLKPYVRIRKFTAV